MPLRSPAEKTKPWYDYRQIFSDRLGAPAKAALPFGMPTRARPGRRVANVTGVPPAVIVAIIGVETFYGRITGSYRVIDALATLAFDYPRRAVAFFHSSELEAVPAAGLGVR